MKKNKIIVYVGYRKNLTIAHKIEKGLRIAQTIEIVFILRVL